MKGTAVRSRTVCFAALSALGLIVAAPATAASYCGASLTNSDGLAKGDMTFNAVSATDCYGIVVGSTDSEASINGLANWQTSPLQWSLLAKSDGANTSLLSGIEFTLAASSGTVGTWTLTAVDTNGLDYANLPAAMDFVGVLKGSNRYAAYFFDDVLVGGDNAGTWEIAFVNNGGNFPDLSHLSLYTRVDAIGGIPAAIPEAQGYAMMLAGLGLVGFVARRVRRAA